MNRAVPRGGTTAAQHRHINPKSGFAFTAALVVLPDTSQSYGDAGGIVNGDSTLLRAAPTAPQGWANRPLDGLLRGQQSSASPTARSSSIGNPNGHLDVAPDRRLVDLKLGAADRPAGAQCAEFGQ